MKALSNQHTMTQNFKTKIAFKFHFYVKSINVNKSIVPKTIIAV